MIRWENSISKISLKLFLRKYNLNFFVVGDLFVKYWIYIKKIRILDSVFHSYTLFKRDMAFTAEVFIFRLDPCSFITYITIVFRVQFHKNIWKKINFQENIMIISIFRELYLQKVSKFSLSALKKNKNIWMT